MNQNTIKVAILDMYNGEPNQGMRCIIDVINRFTPVISFEIFDVRKKAELPNIEKFDIYIAIYLLITTSCIGFIGGYVIAKASKLLSSDSEVMSN